MALDISGEVATQV